MASVLDATTSLLREELPSGKISPSLSSSSSDSEGEFPVQAQNEKRKEFRYYGPKSTYWMKSWSEKTWYEKMCSLGDADPSCYVPPSSTTPSKSELQPPPYHAWYRELFWILPRAGFPILAQQLSYTFFPDSKWNAGAAYLVYWGWFVYFVISTIPHFNYYSTLYGSFDSHSRPRDRVPDNRLRHLATSVFIYLHVRTALPFGFWWDGNEIPFDMGSALSKMGQMMEGKMGLGEIVSSMMGKGLGVMTPVRLGAWFVVLDYFFYVYHRSCHEVPFLWRIHSQHHATKHPTALLALMADDVQEFLEILFCPLMATLAVPMSFHELYLVICMTVYVEIAGHTGIRADWGHPLLAPVLRPLGMELAIEDHDIHHRYGKSGRNYGKQTRIFDVLFGTVAPREEMQPRY